MRYFRSVSLIVGVVFICVTSAYSQNGIVSIDDVTNASSPYQLKAGYTHLVSIRYNFLACQPPGDPPRYWMGSNGFEVFAPDGADWGGLQGSPGPLVALAAARGNHTTFQKHFFFDGATWNETANGGMDPAPGSSGANTRAGFYLATFSLFGDAGYIGGYDDGIALTLEFESRLADVGLTLCVDTCSQITAWEWSNGNEDFPAWDNGHGHGGPRCWELGVWVPLQPEWCDPPGLSDTLTILYDCGQGSYQLCASGSNGPLTYMLVPPFDNGAYGSLDPVTGLWTWAGPSLPQTGSVTIEFQVFDDTDYATTNFELNVSITDADCDCCEGRVGDANNSGDDEPTIGDVSTMIDALFIGGDPVVIACLAEADINQSGGEHVTYENITIGDISTLIDYLFITGPELGLADCL